MCFWATFVHKLIITKSLRTGDVLHLIKQSVNFKREEGGRFVPYFLLLIKICKHIFTSLRFTNYDLRQPCRQIVVRPTESRQENRQT